MRFGGGAPSAAADQPVRFGDVVALELVRPLTTTEGLVDFGTQPQATIGAARVVTFTATANDTAVRRATFGGADVDDFLVSRNECSDVTLDRGDTCRVAVRFAPSTHGERSAELTLRGDAGTTVSPTVVLSGVGGDLPKGETGATGPSIVGPAGPQGPVGTAGTTGPQGATGPQGKIGPRGTTGRRGKTGTPGTTPTATCRVTGKRVQRVRCTVRIAGGTKRSTRVRITRKGKTFANGTLRAKRTTLTARATRKVTRNRYTLRIGSGKKTANLAVRIR